MRSPQFLEIWTAEGWMEYFWNNRPVKTRQYYQLRSAIRTIIWLPFFVGCFYIYVGAVAVFS